jgi:hypothetical protein
MVGFSRDSRGDYAVMVCAGTGVPRRNEMRQRCRRWKECERFLDVKTVPA